MAIPDPATTEWVPIWNPLSEGPVGPAGPAGPTGPQGIPGPAGTSVWIDVPFNAANFLGTGGMTWTVAAGDVSANRYTAIGKTLIWAMNVGGSSLSGTAAAQITIAAPGGFTLTGPTGTATGQLVAGASNYNGLVYVAGGTGTQVVIQPHPFTTFALNSGATYLVFTAIFGIL